MKQVKVGVEAFIIQEDKLLLGLRKNIFGAGSWALPGGHLDFGETAFACLQREMKEELGIKIITADLKTVTDDYRPNDNQHYLHLSFLVKKFSGSIVNCEQNLCEEWKFFSPKKLPLQIFPSHQKILKTFLSDTLYLK